jgi:hypothetical protein
LLKAMQKKVKPVKLAENNIEYPIGEFLIRFYRKRTASFLANIYKAGITGASKDIHLARLDVKKIFSILDLMRIVRSKGMEDPGYEKIFNKVYKASGRIREIQVNLGLLDKKEFNIYNLDPFKEELLLTEKELTWEFLKSIRKFNERKLARNEKRIKEEVREITSIVLNKKTEKYLQTKTRLILRLIDTAVNDKKAHEIRRHLKELSTVLSLLYLINPDTHPEELIRGLNKSERLIGDWHDRKVLADSMKLFLKERMNLAESEVAPIRECYSSLSESNSLQVENIVREIGAALKVSLSSPFLFSRNN